MNTAIPKAIAAIEQTLHTAQSLGASHPHFAGYFSFQDGTFLLLKDALEELRRVSDRRGGEAGAAGTEPPQSAAPERGDAQPKSVVSKEIIDAGQAMYHAAEYNRIQADGRTSLAHACERWRIALSNLGEGMSDEPLTQAQAEEWLFQWYNKGRPAEASTVLERAAAELDAFKLMDFYHWLRDKGYFSRSVEEDPVAEHDMCHAYALHQAGITNYEGADEVDQRNYDEAYLFAQGFLTWIPLYRKVDAQ